MTFLDLNKMSPQVDICWSFEQVMHWIYLESFISGCWITSGVLFELHALQSLKSRDHVEPLGPASFLPHLVHLMQEWHLNSTSARFVLFFLLNIWGSICFLKPGSMHSVWYGELHSLQRRTWFLLPTIERQLEHRMQIGHLHSLSDSAKI